MYKNMKPGDLKITDLRVADIDGLPKHMILLKIYTNTDIVGYGEVRDASSATYAKMLKSRLIGENPLNVEKLFERIRQFGGHSRQGGGVSGVEVALYDIIGKFYGVPVYQLLGGKWRDEVRIYCDTDVDGKHTGTDMGNALKKRMEQGFTFLKMDLGIELLYDEPGTLNAPVGLIEDFKKYNMKAICHQSGSIDKSLMFGKNYQIFTIPHYTTGIHITEKGLDYLENYVKQVRDVIGYEVPLAIDHFGHVAIEDAIRFARRLEKYNIAWMEDLTPWQKTEHLKKFAQNSCVPLCTGEDIYLADNFEKVMQAGVNVVHPDLLTGGGFVPQRSACAGAVRKIRRSRGDSHGGKPDCVHGGRTFGGGNEKRSCRRIPLGGSPRMVRSRQPENPPEKRLYAGAGRPGTRHREPERRVDRKIPQSGLRKAVERYVGVG